jgi:sugar phosphate isomerase/epimerase
MPDLRPRSTATHPSFQPGFAVCQNILPNDDMASDLDLLTEAGIAMVAVIDRLVDGAGVARTKDLLTERSIEVSSYMITTRLLDGDDEEFDKRMTRHFTTADALGAGQVVITTGAVGELSISEADALVVGRLNRIAQIVPDTEIKMTIEPVHPFLRTVSYVHTLRHAIDLVSQTDRSFVLLDVVHTYWDRHIYRDIEASAEFISSVQISDLSPTGIDDRRWVRCSFGDGVVPVADLIYALQDAGFRGVYENEIIGATTHAVCLSSLLAARQWFDALWR